MTSLSQLTSDLRDFRPDQDYLYVGMNDQIAVWKKGRGLDSFYRHLCSFFWSFEKRDVINKLNEQLAGKTIERDVQIAENLRVLLDTRFTKNNKISRRDYYIPRAVRFCEKSAGLDVK